VTATFTVAGGTAAQGEGYRVIDDQGHSTLCTIAPNTSPLTCTGPAQGGHKSYTIEIYAGSWVSTVTRTCDFPSQSLTATCA
jgi:hypothetical protein